VAKSWSCDNRSLENADPTAVPAARASAALRASMSGRWSRPRKLSGSLYAKLKARREDRCHGHSRTVCTARSPSNSGSTAENVTMSNSKASVTTSGLVITICATGLVVLLHYEDVFDFPVVATYLDWITACIYHAVPALTHLPPGSDMWISSVALGALAFTLASLSVALVFPTIRSRRHGSTSATPSTTASEGEN
jgi:hypothetical protein